jgi:hypothetical protein
LAEPATKSKAKAKAKKTNKWGRTAKGGGDKTCSVEGCERPYRAKSYCYFHFKKWRHGELPHSRYRTCSKPECRKKVARHGLCETHLSEAAKGGKPAASAPTPTVGASPPAASSPAPAAPAPEAPAAS